MSENSLIEWTNATWNPLLGCSKCSAGCKLCYAIRTAWRLQHNPNAAVAAAYAGLVEKRADGSLNWTGKINLLPERLLEPTTWKKPLKIFVNSQSDLFHEDVPWEFIDKVFAVMAACRWHTFQLLTKRAAGMCEYMRHPETEERIRQAGEDLAGENGWCHAWEGHDWPFNNVWLGVSVENQKAADERIPHLIETPAAVRFLSCEPLVGPVSLELFLSNGIHPTEWLKCSPPSPLHWVIVGGESGVGARPMKENWARLLRDQCRRFGVLYFFKQWGMWIPVPWKLLRVDFESEENYRRASIDQAATHAVSFDGRVIELSHAASSTERAELAPIGWSGIRLTTKKAAGRLLDGEEHSEFPQGIPFKP